MSLAEQLKQAGYKLTQPRLAVLEVLESKGEHLSHEQILAEGKKIYIKLSRATVYRTLDLLVELNVMRPLYLHEPRQRFIFAAGGHHHLVCTRCQAVFEFDDCVVDQLAQQLSDQFKFQIRNHLLEFQGVCESCRNSD
jgi:Fe2+ or Zn2+ uptake regulation protein